MSIRDFINFHTVSGQERPFWHTSAISGATTHRFMLITEEGLAAINGPWNSAKEQRDLGSMRGYLDAFVEGDEIAIANEPYDKDKRAYLARVDPIEDEIWDIRCLDPSPAIRVLGCFAERDLFVALVWEFRANLDGPGGPLWKAFIGRARQVWGSLFQTLRPLGGVQISDYISGNFLSV